MLGELSPDGAGLLWAEVQRRVLLALVEDAELLALVEVDDGEDTGDRLADVVTAEEIQCQNQFSFFVYNPSFTYSFFNRDSRNRGIRTFW